MRPSLSSSMQLVHCVPPGTQPTTEPSALTIAPSGSLIAPSGRISEPGGYMPPVPTSVVGTVASSVTPVSSPLVVHEGSLSGSPVVPPLESEPPQATPITATSPQNAGTMRTDLLIEK